MPRPREGAALAVLICKEGKLYTALCRQDCAKPDPAWDGYGEGSTEQEALDTLEMTLTEMAPSQRFFFARIDRG